MKHVLVVMMVLCGCATSPAQEAPAKVESTVRIKPPVQVTWEELSRTDTGAVVRARIERLNRLDMSFLMEVELPAGVKLLEGRTKLTLLPNTEAVTVTEQLTLSFDAAPAGDAILKLDGDSGAMGFHYKVPYRFGRAVPEDKGPAATGVSPNRGGKDFGPSVPLK